MFLRSGSPTGRRRFAQALAVGTPARLRRLVLTGRRPCRTSSAAGASAFVEPPLPLQPDALPVVSQALAQAGGPVALLCDRVPFGGELVTFGRDEVTPIRQPSAFLGVDGLLGPLGCSSPGAASGTATTRAATQAAFCRARSTSASARRAPASARLSAACASATSVSATSASASSPREETCFGVSASRRSSR